MRRGIVVLRRLFIFQARAIVRNHNGFPRKVVLRADT